MDFPVTIFWTAPRLKAISRPIGSLLLYRKDSPRSTPRQLHGLLVFIVCHSATRHLLTLSAESHTWTVPDRLARITRIARQRWEEEVLIHPPPC